MDIPLSPRAKAGGVVVLVLVGLGCAVLVSALGDHGTSSTVAPTASSAPASSAIYVHILGAVARPGLYELRDGDRAVDAVAAAGGFTKKADQAGLNLARELSDGEQIIVPKVGAKPQPPPGGGTSAGGLINLNTADAAALETLPGIGEALSSRILAWRESHGSFASVDDLGGVAGIGEKTLGALRDLVTV